MILLISPLDSQLSNRKSNIPNVHDIPTKAAMIIMNFFLIIIVLLLITRVLLPSNDINKKAGCLTYCKYTIREISM